MNKIFIKNIFEFTQSFIKAIQNLNSKLLKIGFIIAAVVVLNLIYVILFMLIWNWIMPIIFGLPKINLWISIGLTALLQLISNPIRIKSSK